MSTQFTKETISLGEGIYSKPQTRVITAYKLWQQNHPTATAGEFLLDNCKHIGYESKYISKWRCDDDNGAYVVKLTAC